MNLDAYSFDDYRNNGSIYVRFTLQFFNRKRGTGRFIRRLQNFALECILRARA